MTSIQSIATPFKPQSIYVWASCPMGAVVYAGKPRNEVALYATPDDAHAARESGDDGFPHETLFQVRIEVIQP